MERQLRGLFCRRHEPERDYEREAFVLGLRPTKFTKFTVAAFDAEECCEKEHGKNNKTCWERKLEQENTRLLIWTVEHAAWRMCRCANLFCAIFTAHRHLSQRECVGRMIKYAQQL